MGKPLLMVQEHAWMACISVCVPDKTAGVRMHRQESRGKRQSKTNRWMKKERKRERGWVQGREREQKVKQSLGRTKEHLRSNVQSQHAALTVPLSLLWSDSWWPEKRVSQTVGIKDKETDYSLRRNMIIVTHTHITNAHYKNMLSSERCIQLSPKSSCEMD